MALVESVRLKGAGAEELPPELEERVAGASCNFTRVEVSAELIELCIPYRSCGSQWPPAAATPHTERGLHDGGRHPEVKLPIRTRSHSG